MKNTAITWATMHGLGVEDAAEYFDTSPATTIKRALATSSSGGGGRFCADIVAPAYAEIG